jgi:hypothetical protein
MILSFPGRGWIVGLITVACLLLSDLATSIQFHDANYYARNGWPKLAAFWIAAGIVRWLLPRHEEDVVLGAQEVSGKKAALRERDSFLLLPVKYWPLVLLALGIGFYFLKS